MILHNQNSGLSCKAWYCIYFSGGSRKKGHEKMGIIENLTSIFTMRQRGRQEQRGSRGEEQTIPLDRSPDGRELFCEDIVAMINSELSRRRDERRPLELQWMLNANFLAGHQYCDINPHRGEVENCRPLHDYMERGIYNRIAPLIETRIANLKSVNYLMTVRPRTNETDDYEKSLVSTKLLRYTQSATDFETRKNMLLLWSELCGSAFILSWWNKDAGRPVGVISDNINKGAADETETAEPCDSAADDTPNGAKSGQTRILREGDLAYGLLTPYEVYPESIYKQEVSDQRSIIVEQVMTTEEIYDTYGIEVEGGSIDTYGLTPVEGAGGYGYAASTMALTFKKSEGSAYVRTYFERPSRRYPRGRLAITAADTLIHYGELPYDEIPIVAVKCKEIAGQFFGRSVIQELIPLQRAYNGCKNKIHDYIQTLASNPLLVPEGSVEDLDLLADEGLAPGSIIEYNTERGVPTPFEFSELPAEVRYESESLARDMEYVAGLSQLMMTGSAPNGVTSGAAIDKLRSIDNTRLSLAGENMRAAVRRLAVIWLQIYKRYAGGYRALSIAGTNELSGVITWCADDINSFDIEYDTENELVISREAQKNAFIEAMQLGLFSDGQGQLSDTFKKRAVEALRLGGFCGIVDESELQLQNARRENSFFEQGIPSDVGIYDDHALHIDEHRRYALQMRTAVLRSKKPEYAALLDAHLSAHEAAYWHTMAESDKSEQ